MLSSSLDTLGYEETDIKNARLIERNPYITRVNRVMRKLGADGRDEAIEFEDAGGEKTVLQFEVLTELKASS